MGLLIVPESFYLFVESVGIAPHQPHPTRLHGLGSFGDIPEHEHGFAQGGGFFLQAAAIGEHQEGLLQDIDQGGVVQGGHQVDVGQATEYGFGGALYVRVGMHGIEQARLGMGQGEGAQGLEDGLQGLAEVFPTMKGDEHQPLVGLERGDVRPGQHGAAGHLEQGVDHGVAHHMDLGWGNALPEQRFPRRIGGGEVPLGQHARQAAIGLFGEGGAKVAAAQARLHMAEGNALVVGGEGRAEHGAGIALGQHG